MLALLLASEAVIQLTPAGLGFAAGAALGFLPVAAVVVRLAPIRPPGRGFGAANAATLLRGVLAGLAAGLLAAPSALSVAPWLPPALVLAGLLLDIVDGSLARQGGLVSEFGTRFDLEVDAWTTLVLAGLVVASGKAPVWALGIGLLHYLLRAAALLAPRLRRPLPPSLRRRLIGGAQMVALGVLLAPPLPASAGPVVAGAALVALLVSFGLDLHPLLRRGHDRRGGPSYGPAAHLLGPDGVSAPRFRPRRTSPSSD
ncbi:MAG: CDP-alcohol phosphatidyltransferase family protein [Thalassobaculum sp.]|uniref:CDP-alcohol phosphatidyltransferase family protein n=1 Tax=Thalassobaculum sp. TaxID=2022740 RepID=UPI0032EBD8EC